jgi:hypothetical protein
VETAWYRIVTVHYQSLVPFLLCLCSCSALFVLLDSLHVGGTLLTIRAYHVIKEEQTKSIVISQDDLIDFIHTAKGTFGIFRVKTGDENFRAERYFLAYLVF